MSPNDFSRTFPHLSIVIPCYNESENVVNTCRQVHEALSQQSWSYEIILVNDGSQDDTASVIRRLADEDSRIVPGGYAVNAGRGRALRDGFARARGTFVASIDADLSYRPHYILDLLGALDNHPEADFAIGSPYMPGGGTQDVPAMRLFISRLGNCVLRYMMNCRYHTFTGIFRCYRRESLRKLVLESDGKDIHLEILSKADALGMRGVEVPAVLQSRKLGTSKFRFGHTAINHINYGFHQKPMLFFGLGGLSLLLLAIGLLIYLFILSAQGQSVANRPLLLFAGTLFLVGIIIVAMGFVAIQNVLLRRDLYKLASQTKQIADRLPSEEQERRS